MGRTSSASIKAWHGPTGSTLSCDSVGPQTDLHPAATFLRAPGCYAYQVDGRGFSYLIVFTARPTS